MNGYLKISVFARIRRFFAAIRSAGAAASAVEAGRTPRPSDLARLGIDPAAFGAINRA